MADSCNEACSVDDSAMVWNRFGDDEVVVCVSTLVVVIVAPEVLAVEIAGGGLLLSPFDPTIPVPTL